MSDVYRPNVLRQWAVYWAPGDVGENGRRAYSDPEQIRCRWEDRTEIIPGREGTNQMSRAVVMVDRDLEEQGQLWEGKIQQLTDSEDPFANPGSFEIQALARIPSRRADQFVRIAYL